MMIEIDRLEIALSGVSTLVAEQAVAGLEAELRRRLGALRGSVAVADVPRLSLGPLDLPPQADAAALRGLIADRLLGALLRQAAPGDDLGQGGGA
ncbi:MAG: hypothetical protein ACFCVH_11965 [Alphaproteobacteria bacterium]